MNQRGAGPLTRVSLPCGHGLSPHESRVTNHPPSSSGLRRAGESRRFSSRHTSPLDAPSISLKTKRNDTSKSTHFSGVAKGQIFACDARFPNPREADSGKAGWQSRKSDSRSLPAEASGTQTARGRPRSGLAPFLRQGRRDGNPNRPGAASGTQTARIVRLRDVRGAGGCRR